MNTGSFIGRMGANPRFFAANGQKKAVMQFSLAVKRPGGQKDAQGNVITDWFDFSCFGKTAELINQYAGKGALVCIEKCHAVRDSYTDKNGQQQNPVKFIVDQIDLEVTFAASKGQNNNGGNNNNNGGTNANNNGYNNNNNGNYNNNGNNFGQGRQQQAPNVDNYVPDGDGDLPF